jgi:glutamine phosphoribosylpyrophosphate amidotransferase
LYYLSINKMLDVVQNEKNKFCSACFDGNYPVPATDHLAATQQLDLFEKK